MTVLAELVESIKPIWEGLRRLGRQRIIRPFMENIGFVIVSHKSEYKSAYSSRYTDKNIIDRWIQN